MNPESEMSKKTPYLNIRRDNNPYEKVQPENIGYPKCKSIFTINSAVEQVEYVSAAEGNFLFKPYGKLENKKTASYVDQNDIKKLKKSETIFKSVQREKRNRYIIPRIHIRPQKRRVCGTCYSWGAIPVKFDRQPHPIFTDNSEFRVISTILTLIILFVKLYCALLNVDSIYDWIMFGCRILGLVAEKRVSKTKPKFKLF